MSGKKIEQVQAALKYVLEQPARGRPVQHHRLRQRGRVVPARVAAIRRQDAAGGPGIRRRASTPAAARTSTARCGPPWANCRTPIGPPTSSSSPTAFPPRARPTSRRSSPTRRRRTRSTRGSSSSASATTSTRRFLDKLARESFGQSEYVRPNEDIEDARRPSSIKRIQSPVLTGVQLEFAFDEIRAEEGKPVNRVYPKDSFDLFAGEQLVVVGRYKKAGAAKVIVRGSVGGERRRSSTSPPPSSRRAPTSRNAFIEKLWAVRRVGEILDELDLQGQERGTGQGAGRAVQAARHPHALHLVHGRRKHESARRGGQNAARPATGLQAWSRPPAPAAWRSGPSRAACSMPAPAAEAARRAAVRGQLRLGNAHRRRLRLRSGYGRRQARCPDVGQGPVSAARCKPGGPAAEQNVRNIGNRTFFRRQGQWIDSPVTSGAAGQRQADQAVQRRVFRAGPRVTAARMSQYMVFDEPVLLNLDGQAYLIEP